MSAASEHSQSALLGASANYRADIDGLRGIAVLAVVVYHAFPAHLKGGFTGVDVFFVISGFLITRIIYEQVLKNQFSITDFYVRRMRRIFPALLVVLISVTLVGTFTVFGVEYKNLTKHILAAVGFLSNFALEREAGYFDSDAYAKPLHHLWSLGVEEQFYFVWPLIVWGFTKIRLNIFVSIIVLSFLSFGESLVRVRSDPVGAFYFPFSRAWELLLGGALAIFLIKRQDSLTTVEKACKVESVLAGDKSRVLPVTLLTRLSLEAPIVVGLALLFLGFLKIPSGNNFPGVSALVPVVGTLLLIGFGEKSKLSNVLLSNRQLVWVGLISYPLYLWHWPLLSFAQILLGEPPSRLTRLALVGLSFILAYITYQFIEQPFRFGFLKKSSTKILASAMLLVGVVSGSLFVTAPPIPIAAHEQDLVMRSDCLSQVGVQDDRIRYCKITDSGFPEIALIGDSHAAALYEGLKPALVPTYASGLLMLGGRLFVDVLVFNSPYERTVAEGGVIATKLVAENPNIKTVIISTRGPVYMSRNWMAEFPDGRAVAAGEEIEAMKEALRRVFALLHENDKEVIFVIENPTMDFDPNRCRRSRLLIWGNEQRCSISRETYLAEHGAYRNLVFEVLEDFPEVKVFDPSEHLCNFQYCLARIDGNVLYDDADHLSVDGARFVARELLEYVLR